jgi:hypothetical protein
MKKLDSSMILRILFWSQKAVLAIKIRLVDFRNAEAAIDDEEVLVSEALNFALFTKMHVVYIRFHR